MISSGARFQMVGINPSLQIHSFCQNRAKCGRTPDPTDGLLAVPMRQHLYVADDTYFPWYAAYKHFVTCIFLVMNALLEKRAQWVTVFSEVFIKDDSADNLLENNVSTLLHSVCMQTTVHGLPPLLTPSIKSSCNGQVLIGSDDLMIIISKPRSYHSIHS